MITGLPKQFENSYSYDIKCNERREEWLRSISSRTITADKRIQNHTSALNLNSKSKRQNMK